MARYFILLAAIVAVAVAGSYKGKCPKIMGKYPFDEMKFNGDWYSMSVVGMSLFEDKPEDLKCGKFHFNMMKDEAMEGMHMTATYKGYTPDNKAYNYEAIMQSFKQEKPSMGMAVWKKEGSPIWSSIYKTSIVATDYETYAVVISCKPTFDPLTKSFGRALCGQILSRTKTMNKDTLNTLTSLISGYDIDVKHMKHIDHSKCTVQHTPAHPAPVHPAPAHPTPAHPKPVHAGASYQGGTHN